MEQNLSEFAITTTKKVPFKHSSTKESIKKGCRRGKKHGFAGDIVFEILTWLPSKSLMRFMCVSKAWKTLIRHDLRFFKLHTTRTRARPSSTHLFLELESRHPAKKLPTTSNLPTQLAHPRHYFDPTEILICSNHCNGLVCLYNMEDTKVYLYNVSTGERKAFLQFHSCQERRAPNLFLGFDPTTERYKLLHFFHYERQPKVKILTLGTNESWREIHDIHEIHSSCDYYSRDCIFLNGVIYWIDTLYILFFRVREEEFGVFLRPETTLFALNKMQSVLQGKLTLYYIFLDTSDNCILVYDDVNKVTEIYYRNPNSKKVALHVPERIGETKYGDVLLATTSLISASSSLVLPDHFKLRHVTSFVENIIPLTFII